MSIITELPGEEWRPVKEYGGQYFVSNFGRVKSMKNAQPRLLVQHKNNKGYFSVALCKNGCSRYWLTHRLVAIAFIENDEPLYKTTVDHIDGDKSNNCANNLRWLSKSDNTREYWKKQREEAEANELI